MAGGQTGAPGLSAGLTAWVDRLKKEALRRGRFTPSGRRALSAAAVVSQPLDYFERRRAAARYNRRFPSDAMRPADGYTLVPAGHLPGTAEIIEASRRIFEDKRAVLEASAPKGKEALREQKKKRSFLKDLLDNEDLRANPVLIDFALSDPLFSIVTNYLGVIPSLNRVDLIYSVPRLNPEEHISSQLFHQDPEGVTQAKVFLNIFDVEEPHGPFTLIPAAESERMVLAIRRQRDVRVRDNNRYLDDEIGAQGGLARVVRLTGPAGTAAIVDTSRCLHSGSRVQPGHIRLCLFIQYCTSLEKANSIDARRFINDPVRSLALRRYAAE